MKKTNMFLNTAIGKGVIMTMVFLCYLSASIFYLLIKSDYLLSQTWSYQFFIILALSLISSILLLTIFIKNSSGIIILIIFQLICKYIVTKPFGNNIWIEFFLIVVILLEGVLLLTNWESVILAVVIIITSFFTEYSGTFWEGVSNDRTLSLKVILFTLTLMFSGLCYLIKYGHDLIIRQKELIYDQNLIIRKLSNANSGFQQYANLAEEKSISSERMRLTREIHDSVGYTMTNLLMMLEACTDLVHVDVDRLEKLLNQSLKIIKNGHKEMRSSLRILRNTKVKKSNSIEMIESLISVFNDSTGVDVSVEYGNIPWNLSPKLNNIVYRFLQEGMTNSLTHGDAKKINIHFWVNSDKLYVNLIDDGNGCLDIKQGIGLRGMEERLAEVSGNLIYQNVHNGFSIKAEIPWKENE